VSLLWGGALAYAGLGLLPCSLAAQRAPVLQQVKVPHPYYYREMFIPPNRLSLRRCIDFALCRT
jgi:hypothetical protein